MYNKKKTFLSYNTNQRGMAMMGFGVGEEEVWGTRVGDWCTSLMNEMSLLFISLLLC